MKGAETFKALAEGETVYFPDAGIKYKLSLDGVPMCKWDMDSTWKKCDVLKHGFWEDECEIGEEYDLTFEEAMQEAINGKKIVCKRRPERVYSFNPAGKLIEIAPCGSDIASISDVLINAKWKVVE